MTIMANRRIVLSRSYLVRFVGMYTAALFVQQTSGLVSFDYYEYVIVNDSHGSQSAEEYCGERASEFRFL